MANADKIINEYNKFDAGDKGFRNYYSSVITPFLTRWEQEHPDQFKLWNDSEQLSISNGETTSGSVYGSCKCPMCRKKYERT
jgi:hypothetical protein